MRRWWRRRKRRANPIGRRDWRRPIVFFLLSIFLLSACSPTYILRAAYEEGKILWRRQPIEGALKKPDLDPKTREQFKLVLDVREYARDQLKFNVKGSYSSYSFVDRENLTYVLMAAPKTELRSYTWWFLFIGSVPYRGYFSEEEARAEAERFEKEGYDIYIRTAPAFSTLGWFDDPLLEHLVKYDRVTLAEIIFHELFHQTLYIGGAGDFNESLANFVGGRAAIMFFQERSGEGSADHLRAIENWREHIEFSRFLGAVAASLRELYGKTLPREETLKLREEIFSRAQKDWTAEVGGRPQHRYGSFAQAKLNNAVIAHFLLYHRDLDLFESIYEASGKDLARTVEAIKEAVRSGNAPFDDVRTLAKKLEAQGSRAGQRFLEAPDRVDVRRRAG
jgi:predicted aminopeptidase